MSITEEEECVSVTAAQFPAGYKETAFIHAISSAGVAHAIARSCREGKHSFLYLYMHKNVELLSILLCFDVAKSVLAELHCSDTRTFCVHKLLLEKKQA